MPTTPVCGVSLDSPRSPSSAPVPPRSPVASRRVRARLRPPRPRRTRPAPSSRSCARCRRPSTSSRTGTRRAAGGTFHEGNDLLAPRNTPAVAVVSGVIRQKVGPVQGNAIWLDGDDGNQYFYAHFDSYVGVPRRVDRGRGHRPRRQHGRRRRRPDPRPFRDPSRPRRRRRRLPERPRPLHAPHLTAPAELTHIVRQRRQGCSGGRTPGRPLGHAGGAGVRRR